jgi:hypothetical protein
VFPTDAGISVYFSMSRNRPTHPPIYLSLQSQWQEAQSTWISFGHKPWKKIKHFEEISVNWRIILKLISKK